ncbi:MAG: hypothetical protein ACKO37_02535 [Vampirovibrionales bacterium]
MMGFGDVIKHLWTSLGVSLPTDFFVKSSVQNTWRYAMSHHPTLMSIFLTFQLIVQGFLLFQLGAAIRNKVKR